LLPLRARHCWKTYVGRPEGDCHNIRVMALNQLGRGLQEARHFEDALSVQEAELASLQRRGAPAQNMLCVQSNLAMTYRALGRHEEALRMRRDVYSGYLKLFGEHQLTLVATNNYALSLIDLKRSKEAKSLLRKAMPVARRVLGENVETTLRMRWYYASVLCNDTGATLDDLREAVELLEDTARTARRVLGGAHPITPSIEFALRCAQGKLRARETAPAPGSS
jgi:tetratricopeptide (TPR) repeat protein